MKELILGDNGGRGFTQQDLKVLQDATTEQAKAFAGIGGMGVTGPVMLGGMQLSSVAIADDTMSDGYFAIGGDIYFCQGSTLLIVPPPGYQWGVKITRDVVTKPFRNGATHAVRTSAAAVYTTVSDPCLPDEFALSDFQYFGAVFGVRGRTAWRQLTVNTGSGQGTVSGNIFYKKDLIANTVIIRGSLMSASPVDFADPTSGHDYGMATVDADCVPPQDRSFTAHLDGSNCILDSTGVSYLKQFTCRLSAGGDISVDFIKPDAGISTYGIVFDAVLGLD